MAGPRILLLTTRTGGGHMNLAHALKQMLGEAYDVDIVDPYPAIFRQYYHLLGQRFLLLWQIQYALTDNAFVSMLVHRVLTLFVEKHIATLIEKSKSQLILSTHPLLSYEIARALERLRMQIPLVFQLTDLEQVHSTWFSEKKASAHLDISFMAPTREIFQQAIAHGIAPHRVHITGRPVRSQFLHVSPAVREEVFAQLDFDPAVFTIFLQGGAHGLANVDQTVKHILAAEVPVQILLAVGNNAKLAAAFAANRGIGRVRVLPFTEQIAPYMAAADMIAGKAGASSLTEAFILEKPFLITSIIPGQETPSLRFLERHNLGWACLQPREQRQLITAIVNDPKMLAEKVVSIRAYKAWNLQANQAITATIEKMLTPDASLSE